MMRVVLALTGMSLCAQLLAADPAATRAEIERNLASDMRAEAELARDANRKPAEVLEFFGLENDMKVLEISPASGYWSKFLGPTLCGGGGELVFSVGVSDRFKDNVMSLHGLECSSAINDSISLGSIPAFEFDSGDFDMVLTFWNLHNPSPGDRENMNRAVFNALKSGASMGWLTTPAAITSLTIAPSAGAWIQC